MTIPEPIRNLIPPQRINMAVMAFFGIVLAYAMRSCLSVAITVMVVPKTPDNSTGSDSVTICPVDPSQDDSSSASGGFGTKYAWTQQQQGVILSSFYFGYWITHIPGAVYSQKFGGKWPLSLGLLSTAIFTVITPISIHLGDECSHMTLFILRFLMGLGEGITFPAVSTLIAAWIPETERGTIGSFVYSGVQIGSVVSYFFSGLILSYYKWDSVFYCWGFVTIIWFIIFTIICFNDPASDPFISQKERDYLQAEMGQLQRKTDLPPTPWRAIVTSTPVLVLILAQIGHDWGLFVMVNDLPKYMKEVLGFSVREVGIYASLPYLAMWIVSIACGIICDFVIKRECTTTTCARKWFSLIGQIIPGIFMIGASYSDCDKPLVVAMFVLAMATMGPYYAGVRVNALDLSPNYAGAVMALKNGIGSLCGGMAPTVVGWILQKGTLAEWRTVFIVTFLMLCVTILPFMFLGSGEVQKWNYPKDKDNGEQVEHETAEHLTKQTLK